MAKFKKLAIVSSSLLATAMLAAFGVACDEAVCEHKFEKKSNDTHTWYECTNEGCDLKVGEEAIPAAHTHDFKVKTSEDGKKTWYECECGAKTPEEDVATPHTHAFELKKDADKHWYECGCNVKVGEDEHIWDEGEETIAPEVGVAGEYTYTCQVCGQTYTEEVPALEANPLVVAEGIGAVTNTVDKGEDLESEDDDSMVFNPTTITVPMTAGSYIISLQATNLDENAYVAYAINDDWCSSLQFDVEEDGDMTFVISCMSGRTENIEFSYIIKKVPSITPDVSEMEGEVEIVTYAWVKVSVTIPVAGRFAIGSENAYFAADQYSSGENIYIFEAREANEEVVFYVKAMDESEETTVINYSVEMLYAESIMEGNNTVELLANSTLKEFVFTSDKEAKYKISTYDEYAVFWKDTDYNVLDSVNGFTYFETAYDEATEEYTANFFVSSFFSKTTAFNISELTAEDLADSSISWTFEEGATVATTTKTLAQGTNLINFTGMGVYQISWTDPSISLNINDVESTTQSVVFVANPRAQMELSFTNYNFGETEDTFTLTMIDGTNNVINGTVEIFLAGMGVELPAQLTAGDYTMSVNSENALAVWGLDFSTGEGTAEITTETVTVAATGEVETLYVQGGQFPEMVVLTITAKESEGGLTGTGAFGDPYIIPANGGEYADLAMQFNMMQNKYFAMFSYTATADGVLRIANASPNEVMDDNGMVDAADFADDFSWYDFAVTAGMTYSINLSAMGLGAETISPTFTFTATGAIEGTGAFGDPYIIPANGGEYTDLAMQFNMMQNKYFAMFSFTATENGVLRIANASPNEVMDDNGMVDAADFADDFSWYDFAVTAGMTYSINLSAMGLGAETISPTFTFTANA